jgi:hypothetical protein
MLFTVHGDHPDGVHSTFLRISPVGAVLKAPISLAVGGRGFTFAMKRTKLIGLIASINCLP